MANRNIVSLYIIDFIHPGKVFLIPLYWILIFKNTCGFYCNTSFHGYNCKKNPGKRIESSVKWLTETLFHFILLILFY